MRETYNVFLGGVVKAKYKKSKLGEIEEEKLNTVEHFICVLDLKKVKNSDLFLNHLLAQSQLDRDMSWVLYMAKRDGISKQISFNKHIEGLNSGMYQDSETAERMQQFRINLASVLGVEYKKEKANAVH